MRFAQFLIFFPVALLIFASCKKQQLPEIDGGLTFHPDTIKFDTIFTGFPTPTERLIVHNFTKKEILINSISLENDANSVFTLNIDGFTKNSFSNYRLRAGDSMFIFIQTIPLAKDLLIEDKVIFRVGSKVQSVPVQLYSKDAVFYYGDSAYCNLQFGPGKPHVIIDSLVIPSGCTLTISAGAHVYFSNYAVLYVDGTLNIIGGPAGDSVVLQGTRMHCYYDNLPGQWGGIYLRSGSKNNFIRYAVIKNAVVGIRADYPDTGNPSNPKLVLENTIIHSMISSGIVGFNTNIKGTNVLVHNCFEYAVQIEGGGVYDFNFSTFSDYGAIKTSCPGGYEITHTRKKSLLRMGDYDYFLNTAPLSATFTNCIVWGSPFNDGKKEEIELDQKGTNFVYTFDHCLLKTELTFDTSLNNLLNTDPLFTDPRNPDYHLQMNSPAKGKGKSGTGVADDLEGITRFDPPTIGAYEVPP